MSNLVYKHERPLFVVSLVISVLVWLALLVATLGLALFYALFAFVLYLFAQSALVAYLRGTAVKITREQFPDLHERLLTCCKTLGVDPVPDTYLLHGDGAFNAFATRFLGANFVVLLSDVADALESRPGAINYYLGHELGHIHRKHMTWAPVLLPASLLPLLGAAYRRAQETTCDYYGAACCDDPEDALAGLAALAAGKERWKNMAVREYVRQASATGGFWMSLHELISDYPWLVKRAARLTGRFRGHQPPIPSRHPFAYLFAIFVPRAGAGGVGVFVMLVLVVAVVAAVGIPSLLGSSSPTALLGDSSPTALLGDEVAGFGDGVLTSGAPTNETGTTTLELKGGVTEDPLSLPVVAGGSAAVSNLTAGGHGYVDAIPDASVEVSDPGALLRFYVESQEDTVLVVRTPSGELLWNDDSVGVQPVISIDGPEAGDYDVWVGTYSETTAPATLAVTRQALQLPQG